MQVEFTGLGLEVPDGESAEIPALALWTISHLASFLLACPLLHYSLFSKCLLFWACSSSPPFLKASLVVLWVLRGNRKEAHIY